MITKRISLILILSVLVSIIFISCKHQKDEWQGTIEEVDGVTVIKNPIEPIYGQDVCFIEEELSIGEAEGREEYMFSQLEDVGVDDEENIYILDFKEAHINVFDRNGEYLRTIGRLGQGPGEIQRPLNFDISPQNEIIINDRGARSLHFFSLDGNYIRSLSQATLPIFSRPVVDSDNNIVARYTILDNIMTFVLSKFDIEMNELFKIYSYEYQSNPEVLNLYMANLFWEVIDGNKTIWGHGSQYEFHVVDMDGQVIKRISKNYNPIEITEEEKKEWEMRFYGEKGVPPNLTVNWNRYHNAFQFMNVDDEGRVFVQTHERANVGYFYDVFNSNGKYIAKIPFGARPYVIRKGKLYTIEEDEDGFQYVKRYKVTWNIN